MVINALVMQSYVINGHFWPTLFRKNENDAEFSEKQASRGINTGNGSISPNFFPKLIGDMGTKINFSVY